ncbi:MAG: hypothetical protein KF753_10225 [Caldilineaceae bacterium]|nr:hypothetical protein [Caldilineaceae bacterium]
MAVYTPAAQARLGEMGILIRSVSGPDLLRASTSFYNDESDGEKLRRGIEEVSSER